MDWLVTLASSDPMEHLLQRHMLFDFIQLPEILWRDWIPTEHGWGLGISKPVIYMWIAAAITVWIFSRVAKNWQAVPRGLQAWVEPLLLFVRDDIVRANIRAPHHHGGGHGHGDDHGHGHGHGAEDEKAQREKDLAVADSFLPLCWTLFFFILMCNLIGLTPHGIAPTGQFSMTAALAVVSMVVMIGAGIRYHGGQYFLNLVPPSVPMFFFGFIPNPIWLMVFVLEFAGLFFKPFALCIRLMANMTGGHVVILTMLGFAVAMQLFHPMYSMDPAVPIWAGAPIALISIVLAALITGFEVLIALVQAYVFTLLTATFIGMMVSPDH